MKISECYSSVDCVEVRYEEFQMLAIIHHENVIFDSVRKNRKLGKNLVKKMSQKVDRSPSRKLGTNRSKNVARNMSRKVCRKMIRKLVRKQGTNEQAQEEQ
jgi:hypothetical protein